MQLSNSIPGATFNISGTNPPSGSFSWTPTINDVGNHLFTVEVVDNACPLVGRNAYTYTIQVLPNASSLNVNVNTTDPTCNNSCTATASAVVTGGNGNYSYLWSNGATTQDISGLVAGCYTVIVSNNGFETS